MERFEFCQFQLYAGHLSYLVEVFILSNKALLEEYTEYANDALDCCLFSTLGNCMVRCTFPTVWKTLCTLHNLDTFSAFKFEDFTQTLKRLVRKPEASCCQVSKRLLERPSVHMQRVESLDVRREHTFGPLPPLFHCAQYNTELFTLKLDQANSHDSVQGTTNQRPEPPHPLPMYHVSASCLSTIC